MIETVVALLLILNGNIIEHTYKDSMAACLKSRRIAQREVNPESVVFSCKKLKQIKKKQNKKTIDKQIKKNNKKKKKN